LRRINGTALVIAALVATVGALAFPVWSYADRSGTGAANLAAGTVNTRWGPLSAADRDFVVRVRLAGLWEIPAGQQAIERAPTKAIKEAGDHLIVGHTDLDKRVRVVAADLGIELPNQPNAQQQGWLQELSAAQGKDYDIKFANLLRSAHGKIFAVLGSIRNSTRNSLVRQLATDANQTVLDHITMLEATGDVDFDAIANAAAATTTASPTGPAAPAPGVPPASAPPAQASGDVNVTSSPSPLPPGEVNTSRPDPTGDDAGGQVG
jgi:putative membrane protein